MKTAGVGVLGSPVRGFGEVLISFSSGVRPPEGFPLCSALRMARASLPTNRDQTINILLPAYFRQ